MLDKCSFKAQKMEKYEREYKKIDTKIIQETETRFAFSTFEYQWKFDEDEVEGEAIPQELMRF